MTREGWRRLGVAVRERDLPGILILVSRPLRVVRFDRMLILETSLVTERPLLRKARERAPDLLVRTATGSDLPELTRRFPHAAAKYSARLQNGDECFLVESGDSLIAMGWIGSESHRPSELGCRIELPPGAVWGYDSFVLEEHRMQSTFAVLMHAMLTALQERGNTRLYAAVSHFNTASRASHARIGYMTAAVLDRFVVTGTSHYRISTRGREKFWLRGSAGGPPVLRLGEESSN